MHTLFDYGYTHRDMREDRADRGYDDAWEVEDKKRRMEHEAEFDFPYVSDGKQVHEAITSRKAAAL